MGSGVRRAVALLASLFVVSALVAAPPVQAATITPADCTIFVTNGLAVGTDGDDVICGTEGDDTILGSGGNDTIFGFGGNDWIDGGAGADWLEGGYGYDEIEAGPGDDYASGGPGADRLWGQDGLDDLVGGSGDDALAGGPGADDLTGGYGVDYCKKDAADTTSSCYFDTSKPTLVAAAMGTPSVDTSLAPKMISVRVRLKDTGTGIGYISLTFARHFTNGQTANDVPLEAWVEGADQTCTAWGHAYPPTEVGTTNVCLVSGTPRDGVYELRTLLPRWQAQGTYRLTNVRVRDLAYNTAGMWWDTLTDKGLAISFKQTGAGDSYAPLVRDVALITKSVDTSLDRRVVGARVHITDGTSGVGGATLEWARVVRFADGGVKEYRFPQPAMTVIGVDPEICVAGVPSADDLYSGARDWSCRESGGTRNDAWYRVWTVLPRWTGKGTYELVDIITGDRAGNRKVMMFDEIAYRGVAASFAQVGTGDETAPTVSELQMLTPSVSTGTDAVQVKVRIRVKDAVSGLGMLDLGFEAQDGSGQGVALIAGSTPCDDVVQEACRVSGTDQDGIYEATAWLPAHAAAGTWKLTTLLAQDKAGNNRWLYESSVPALSFTNS